MLSDVSSGRWNKKKGHTTLSLASVIYSISVYRIVSTDVLEKKPFSKHHCHNLPNHFVYFPSFLFMLWIPMSYLMSSGERPARENTAKLKLIVPLKVFNKIICSGKKSLSMMVSYCKINCKKREVFKCKFCRNICLLPICPPFAP